MKLPLRPTGLAPACAVLIAFTAFGCSGLLGKAKPDTSSYFVLSSTDTSATSTSSAQRPDVRVGLGPIKMPGYLDAQGIVRSGGGGSVSYVPKAFWAEPLADGFARALLYRTEARIGTPHGVSYPWYSTERVEWKIPVDVLRFEATTDGRAILVARWSVERAVDGVVVAGAQSVFEENAGNDAAAIVDALSRCVDRLAEAIAAGVTGPNAVPAPAARSASAPDGRRAK